MSNWGHRARWCLFNRQNLEMHKTTIRTSSRSISKMTKLMNWMRNTWMQTKFRSMEPTWLKSLMNNLGTLKINTICLIHFHPKSRWTKVTGNLQMRTITSNSSRSQRATQTSMKMMFSSIKPSRLPSWKSKLCNKLASKMLISSRWLWKSSLKRMMTISNKPTTTKILKSTMMISRRLSLNNFQMKSSRKWLNWVISRTPRNSRVHRKPCKRSKRILSCHRCRAKATNPCLRLILPPPGSQWLKTQWLQLLNQAWLTCHHSRQLHPSQIWTQYKHYRPRFRPWHRLFP